MPSLKDLGALRGNFTPKLLLIYLVLNLSVFSFGFDDTVYSTIQAMPPYAKMFGRYNEETQQWGFSARHLSFLNSLGGPARIVGTLLGYFVGQNFGRKPCFIGMQFIVIIGVAVTYSATTFGQALAGRIIVQLYAGVENWLIPMLLAELSPAPIRGASVILYVLSHQLGSLICSFITLGTSKLHDNRSWQIPVGVMWLFPGLCLILSFFIPESPRWLVRQNRNGEASKSLLRIYGSVKGFDADDVTARLAASIEADSVTTGSWSDLLKGTNLRRIHIALAVSVFSQFTGGAFVTQYGTLFVRSLGTFDPFSWTVLLRVAMMIGPMVSFATIDTYGRRPVYLAGSSIASALMFAIGGLGIGHVTTSGRKGIVAATILWGPCYTGAFGALGAVIAAEVPHLRLRDKSSTLSSTTRIVFDFIVAFNLPYLMNAPYANLQSKVGLIFGSIASIAVIWAYFFMPELHQRSLEETEIMWAARVPARKMKDWKAPALVSYEPELRDESGASSQIRGQHNKDETVERIVQVQGLAI